MSNVELSDLLLCAPDRCTGVYAGDCTELQHHAQSMPFWQEGEAAAVPDAVACCDEARDAEQVRSGWKRNQHLAVHQLRPGGAR